MVKYNMFYYKQYILTLVGLLCMMVWVKGQGNCLLLKEDSGERKACELSYQAIEYRQGSQESQNLFDEAIRVGPKYAYAYYQKSVPFFKRGLFAEGISLINKAIELEPQHYLYYRAYYYYHYKSYDLCIKDLEILYTQHEVSFVTTPGGGLEMRILLALSYAHTNRVKEGLKWMQNLMTNYTTQPHLIGFYDHFCLGVLFYKDKQFELALEEFNKQLLVNDDFIDTYYYLGLIEELNAKKESAIHYFQLALEKMSNGGYATHLFPVFMITEEIVENKLAVFNMDKNYFN